MTDAAIRNLWRACFVLGGITILAGGPMHPEGTMEEMLKHPDWFAAHALITVGFAAMAAGLFLWGRNRFAGPATRRWLRPALALTILQGLDMAVHTAAMVDHERLAAGLATPVLTTHLWLTAIVYPVFAVAVIGFLLAAGRDRVLGSWWIAWIGIAGAAGHGLAGPLTVVFEIPWARALFPLLVLVGIWMLLAACWPARAAALPAKAAARYA
jgi:hypothetical protein